MFADPVKEIDGLLDRLRAARHDAQLELAAGIADNVAALAAGEKAQRQIDAARQFIRDANAEIDQLLEERQRYVPKQRSPFD